jgi:hypothetical protein
VPERKCPRKRSERGAPNNRRVRPDAECGCPIQPRLKPEQKSPPRRWIEAGPIPASKRGLRLGQKHYYSRILESRYVVSKILRVPEEREWHTR